MFRITGLDHVVLRARDVGAMVRFYSEVLGCAVEREVAELGLVQLRAGSSLIDLVDVAGELGRRGGVAAGREGRNMDHFCLRVEPFDSAALFRHLGDHGIEAGPVERRYGAEGSGPSIYIAFTPGQPSALSLP
jgi:catechol 2,3-dioxygenase-like lactoylglutathione lyase family enzyme